MKKKVGIVTINWNNYEDTKEFIDSMLSIYYEDYVIFIVDNDSTDNSLVLLMQEFEEQINSGRIKFVESNVNRGFAGGNNLGFKCAFEQNCDLILMINNDTIVSPDFLNPMINKMYIKNNIGIVTGKIYYYEDKKVLWSIGGELNLLKASAKYYGTNEVDEGQFDKIQELGIASGCFMLIDCLMLRRIGLLSENFFFRGEEWEFSYRVRNNGYKIVFEPKAHIYHKVSRSHNRLSYYDIYSAYRGKLIFSKSYIKKPIWFFWFIFFIAYSISLSFLNFKKSSDNKISYLKYLKTIKMVVQDGISRNYVTSQDIEKVKLLFDSK